MLINIYQQSILSSVCVSSLAAAAMRALNAKGIVHRDLKPQNILLCHSGIKPNPHPKEMTLKIGESMCLLKALCPSIEAVTINEMYFKTPL